MAELQSILTSLGIEAAQAQSLLTDENPDITGAVSAIRANVETQIKNDPNFWNGLDEKNIPELYRKKIEGAQYARATNETRLGIMKKFGLNESDYAEIGDDVKNYGAFLEHTAKLVGNKNNIDPKLQADLIEAKKQLEVFENEKPTIEKTFKDKYEAEYNAKVADMLILSSVAGVAGLKANASYVSPVVADKLKQQYHLEISGNNIELRQKENHNLKALNSQGTKEISLSEAITAILKSDNMIDEGTQTNAPRSGTATITPVNGSLQVSGHISQKMEALLAAEKADNF